MSDRMKMIIADDEENICNMLKNVILFDELKIELVGMAFDGIELLELIEREKPDIVITDINMPRMDGLKVIENCRKQNNNCKFIVISGYRQFEYAYNALKYDVSDYILKPVNEDELNSQLKKVIDDLRAVKFGEIPNTQNDILKGYFLNRVLPGIGTSTESLQELNHTYGLSFADGLFSFAILKVDDLRKNKTVHEDLASVLNKLMSLSSQKLEPFCHCLVFSRGYSDIEILMNYDQSQNEKIYLEFKAIFEESRGIVDLFQGLSLTICLGSTCNSIYEVESSRKTAKAVAFSRMGFGTNRILTGKDLTGKLHPIAEKNLQDILRNAEQGITSLDIARVMGSISSIFNLPEKMLCSYEIPDTIEKIVSAHSENMSKILQNCSDDMVPPENNSLLNEIYRCTGFDECRELLLHQLSDELEYLMECVEKKNSKPIRQACQYIDEHLDSNIRLEDVCNDVGLSTAYFSNIFSKKMGQTFSDYVSTCKIQKACDYLTETDMNINEIAAALGYADNRSFAKTFRKKIGIKPTEYRKIYG